jgi:ubiquinone/menaquinone biosynthesis C-methylase UbiE
MTVLDVGCGSGHYQKSSKFRGAINIDVLKPEKKIPNFVLCDAQSLPFRECVFEKVYFYDVLEHLEKPVQCLKDIKRVTKHNGVIVLGTPNALFFPKILLSAIKGKYYPDGGHIATYGLPELKNLLTYANFKNFHIYTVTYRNDKDNIMLDIITRLTPKVLKSRQLKAIIHKNS